MNEKDCVKIDYFVHEGEMARAERHMKRLWIALMIVIGLLFVSNATWLYAWMQYDYSVETVDLDADGNSNASYVGNDGGVNNVSTYIGQKSNED